MTSTVRPVRRACAASLLALLLTSVSHAAMAGKKPFRIDAKDATVTLTEFARQAGIQILFGYEHVKGITTNAIDGEYEPLDAIRLLVQGTGLQVSEQSTGVLFVAPLKAGASGDERTSSGAATHTGDASGPSSQSSAGRLRLAQAEQGAASTSASGGGAEAASGSRAQTSVLYEIVVTGTKLPTTLTETPQAISVITSKEMELRGVQDLNAALSYSAGVKFRDYPGQQGMQDFYLRGFRANNTAGSVFRDGLRLQFNNLDGDVETYGLERIEFFKGPSSVLYGQAAPGGMINAITKRPPNSALGEVVLQGGSYDRKQGAIDIGGPIDAAGTWLYRATALVRDSQTQFDYTSDDRVYAAPALTWAPSEDTDVTLLTQVLSTATGASEQSFPVSGTELFNPNGPIRSNRFMGDPSWNDFTMDNYAAGYDFNHRFSESLSFNQVLRYSMSRTSLEAVVPTGAAALGNNRLLSRLAVDRLAKSRQLTTDAHLTWTLGDDDLRHTLVGGVDYSWHRRTNVQRNGTIAPLDVYAPVYNVPITWASTLASDLLVHLKQKAVYLQEQTKWNNLVLTFGGRQDWVRSETVVRNAGLVRESEDNKFTGRVGAIYETSFGLAPYVSYSTSFQPIPGTTFSGVQFEATEGKQIEVGLKQELAPGSLVTLAVYELTQENVTTPDLAHVGFFVQQGEVRARGVELEARAQLTDAFNLIGAYAYTDAETTKANPNAAGISMKGLKQLGIPEHNVSLWGDYTFRLGGERTLNIGAGARYVTETFNTDNSVEVSGYTLVDATVSLDWSNYSLAVNVSNLLDETYFTPGFYAASVFYGYRRTVLGTLRYRW